MGIPSVPPGAMCSVHGERPARVVCDRCGDFACEICVPEGEARICAACRARGAGFGLHRDNWTLAGVLGIAADLFKAAPLPTIGITWLGTLVFYVVATGPLVALSALAAEWMQTLPGRLTTQVVYAAVTIPAAPLLMGVYAYCVARLHGRAAGVGHLWSQWSRVPALVPLAVFELVLSLPNAWLTPASPAPEQMLEQLGAFVGASMLASVYGWIVYVLVQFVLVELVVDPQAGGAQALRAVFAHLGRRPFSTFGSALLLSFLGFLALSCCFLPAIVVMPVTTLAFTALWLAARTPPPA